MPTDPLPPDPESLEAWRKLPQNRPSREAMPPATGGMKLARGLLIVLAVLLILSLLLRQPPL